MKNEILNKGLDATIDCKQRNINNLILMLCVMVLTAFSCVVLLAHRTKKVEALEFQIQQRDAKIANLEATINELTYDLNQKYFNDGK
jgi:cell division protein FtsB